MQEQQQQQVQLPVPVVPVPVPVPGPGPVPMPMAVPQRRQQQQQQQQAAGTDSGAAKKMGVSFGTLMPFLQTLVSPEQQTKLDAIYLKMKKDEISREDFVRGARVIAGEKVILEALHLMNKRREDSTSGELSSMVSTVEVQPASHFPPQFPVESTQRKSLIGQKKAAETVLVQPGKKQKLGSDPVQSLDQINDVAAVSGVNLKEEEEILLAGPKEESRTTAEMRRRLSEEEGTLFLERGPLHAKVQEIAANAGLKSISEDVERCLSMCAEEWLWNFLLKSTKISKQRCDVEKDRHRIMSTLDLQKPINLTRKKQKEIRQRKQAEENERLRKLNEEKGPANDEGKEGPTKSQKAQQQQDDKMRTTAANIAARKAVGADDVLSKWMLMAEQRQQQRQASAMAADGGVARDQEQAVAASAGGKASGGVYGAGRLSARRSALPQAARASRSIILKDLVACLEREPRMCKSALLYRFYERLSCEEA